MASVSHRAFFLRVLPLLESCGSLSRPPPHKALQLTGPPRVPGNLWYRLALNPGASGRHRRRPRQL